MQTPQTIVIIGEGEKSKGIARCLSDNNGKVLYCHRDLGLATDFVSGLIKSFPHYDIEAVECTYDATWEADLIILALPCEGEVEVADNIRTVANQKIVVATGDASTLQRLLPHSKIVQAFSDICDEAFFQPAETRSKIFSVVHGEDPDAVETVRELVTKAGFLAEVDKALIPEKKKVNQPFK
jgi:predicted dinucleotide-binding enzyme